MNTVSLAKDPFIRKGEGGGGGGVTINNQEKSLEITENGVTEVTADSGFTGLSKVIVNTNVASSGGGALVSKPVNDVNFYDYDGTILHSYTKDEFLALSAMPPLPEMEGLICQEWNWGYEEAQKQVAEYGMCDIGATYITDDGKTRIYIKIPNDNMTVSMLAYASKSGIIDWGDGTEQEILQTSNQKKQHTYSKRGYYVIVLSCDEGALYLSDPRTASLGAFFSPKVCREIHLGHNASLSKFALYNFTCIDYITFRSGADMNASQIVEGSGLRHMNVPQNTTTCDLRKPTNLRSISLPNSMTAIIGSFFNGCSLLGRVVIPSSVITIGSYAFSGCSLISELIIPPSVTSIDAYAFASCSSLVRVDFSRHTSVPSLGNKGFNSSSLVKIVVPDALYDEWTAATNWSTYASKIIKKSDWDAQS